MEQLTAHFSLSELIESRTARARGIDNTPGPEELENLRRLAATLEKVRETLGGRPILISSGYRCEALNSAVGGSPSSAHRLGLAVDFTCPDFGPPWQICQAIVRSRINFDQLICEYGRWVHLGLCLGTPRQQLLTINSGGTHTGLHVEGLHA